ncbi:MAG TPA: carbonic anhydrase [Bryobacteraceae bacterium]|nr:carbonic anhydrase [Bryobacteraceae bacterium]
MGFLATHLVQTRRNFLVTKAHGVTAGLIAVAGGEIDRSHALLAQTASSPDAAVQELLAGNKRFISGHMTAYQQDLAILRQKTAEQQEPFAAVLSCADSRVPVELIFDQSIGHIFVVRVAGNVVTPEVIASLEYGTAVLGTKAILVLAHANCGAIKATIQGKEAPGQITALYSRIQPSVDQAGSDVNATAKANAKLQSALLRKASTVVSSFVKEKKLTVIAAFYDIAGGKVTLLE